MSDLFACPNCGATDEWEVWYETPESQRALVLAGPDGEPVVEDYLGCGNSGDSGPDTSLWCGGCDWSLDFNETAWLPVDWRHTLRVEAAHWRTRAERLDALEAADRVDAVTGGRHGTSEAARGRAQGVEWALRLLDPAPKEATT